MAKRTSKLGGNPLDALAQTDDAGSSQSAQEGSKAAKGQADRQADKSAPARPERPKSVPKTFRIPPELRDRLENAVVALQGAPVYATMSGMATEALERELDRLEAEHNGGGPFPPAPVKPKTGRPVGS